MPSIMRRLLASFVVLMALSLCAPEGLLAHQLLSGVGTQSFFRFSEKKISINLNFEVARDLAFLVMQQDIDTSRLDRLSIRELQQLLQTRPQAHDRETVLKIWRAIEERRRKPSASRKLYNLSVRVTGSEMDSLRERAKRAGLSTSDFVIRRCLGKGRR